MKNKIRIRYHLVQSVTTFWTKDNFFEKWYVFSFWPRTYFWTKLLMGSLNHWIIEFSDHRFSFDNLSPYIFNWSTNPWFGLIQLLKDLTRVYASIHQIPDHCTRWPRDPSSTMYQHIVAFQDLWVYHIHNIIKLWQNIITKNIIPIIFHVFEFITTYFGYLQGNIDYCLDIKIPHFIDILGIGPWSQEQIG